MTFLETGFDLIRTFEGCKLTTYPDQGGTLTIGWGHTQGVSLGMSISQAQADSWLVQDVAQHETQVRLVLKRELSDSQYTACVCLTYNVGILNFTRSTLLVLLNQGEMALAAEQFPRWCKVDGVPNAGLLRRRLAEQALFLSPPEAREAPAAPKLV